MKRYDYAVIGGGIVGLSTAYHLGKSFPKARILLLEKEGGPAMHQTGRNSGVIHSGIYYKPGSFKAKFAMSGATSMVAFCKEHGIPHEVCGKIIVATKQSELALLENLYQRGIENGCPVEKMSAERVREIEPHVQCAAGVRVLSTGITSYLEVAKTYLELIQRDGGVVKFGARVIDITSHQDFRIISTPTKAFAAKAVINCAGLHSDRVAQMAGADPGARIVPFRGEYFELVPERRHLVKTLIYPVPNPNFPFLGVHFTRMIDGSVHAGPNAVLALKREGYAKTDFNLRDVYETLAYKGFWKLAGKNLEEGLREIRRSFSKAAFVQSLQRMIPEIAAEDLVPCKSGVRAQALWEDGSLVDDFLIVKQNGDLHVCNAPSPAATASIEIGKSLVRKITQSTHLS